MLFSVINTSFATQVQRTSVDTNIISKAIVFDSIKNVTYELEPIYDDKIQENKAILSKGDIIFFNLVASGEFVSFDEEKYEETYGIEHFWISIYIVDEDNGEVIETILDEYLIENYPFAVVKVKDNFKSGLYKVKIIAKSESSELFSTTVEANDINNTVYFMFQIN